MAALPLSAIRAGVALKPAAGIEPANHAGIIKAPDTRCFSVLVYSSRYLLE